MPPRHVYVHVPFCARRCSYCDFAIAVRRDVPVDEYLDAIRTELSIRFPDAETWAADTLYLGGGTPSRLGGEGVARLLDLLRDRIDLEHDAEVTIEANPEDVDLEAARRWREAGVNRISLGSQSFDDRVLAWMHRVHSASRIAEAVEAARAAGVQNLSLDLIFALPAALERDWERDVASALALAPDHLSLYGLTVEPHTPLGRWRARGAVEEASEEGYEAEYLHAHEALAAAGHEHYEVSNFGKPGRHSRHNRSYWRGVPYAGLGPGAHEFQVEVSASNAAGCDDAMSSARASAERAAGAARRRWNVGAYAAWAKALAEGRDPVAGEEMLTEENRTAEEVYLGLRTADGLRLRPGEEADVARWIEAGWARLDGGVLRLTPLGWLRLDALAAALTDIRSR